MDDLNDIRLALGALTNLARELDRKHTQILERLDDLGAFMARAVALSELLDDLEALTAELPAALRSLQSDPMLGMMLGGPAAQMADQLEAFLAERRDRRAAPPAIERT